ncbi:MAG: GMP synthase [Proteobacteria bacterium]|nr:GMP synthase [Pseudomonadota bacterium]
MKVALLQCDNVLEKFQPEFGNYPAMVQSMFDGVDEVLEFETFDCQQGQYPQDIHAYDFYITTGSKASAYDDLEWVEKLIAFVQQLDGHRKKLIGICFGHQIIALARGGVVEKAAGGWGIGIARNDIVNKPSWMKPPPAELNILVSHQDQVLQLDGETKIIAKSDFCPFFVVQWGQHFLSIQGHPEWKNAYSRTLMNDRRAIIPAECIESGMASLDKQPDNALFVDWIMDFVKH